MNLLKTITNKDFGVDEVDEAKLHDREAVRAVLLNDQNKVAILSVTNGSYHKIPGGGIEAGEDHKHALAREIMEEAGAEINILGEVGSIFEFRKEHKQYSYCYLAKVIGTPQKPKFTNLEFHEGFEAPEWLQINDAIKLFKMIKRHFCELNLSV